MSWKEVKTVITENDGETLYIDGFDSDRIRVTAMLATVTDNKGLRFSISEDEYDRQFCLGTSTSTEFFPITFELAAIGEFASSTAFCLPKNSAKVNATNAYAGGTKLPNGETTLKRFQINSANDKLKAGSWVKIEVWE